MTCALGLRIVLWEIWRTLIPRCRGIFGGTFEEDAVAEAEGIFVGNYKDDAAAEVEVFFEGSLASGILNFFVGDDIMIGLLSEV